MRSRGLTYKEVLLLLGVIVVAAAVLIPISMTLQRKQLHESDITRMRQLYLSLAIYESEADGYMPPNLAVARPYAPDDLVFVSVRDPFLGGQGPFPVDGSLPEWQRTSPIRVSFAFLYAFRAAGKAQPKEWYELKYDPKVGLLANEWLGAVRPGERFHADVSGLVLRLNTDGALAQVHRGGPKPLGDAQDLFFRR